MDRTEEALARFQRRMASANQMYDQAESLRKQADGIEQRLNLPDHERPVGDEATLELEARLLRDRADELTRQADGIQQRLQRPAPEFTKQIEEWGKRMRDRGHGNFER